MNIDQKSNPIVNIAADTVDNEDRYLLTELMLKKGYSPLTTIENSKNVVSYGSKDALQWALYHQDLNTFNLLLDYIVEQDLRFISFCDDDMPYILKNIIEGFHETIMTVDTQFDFFCSFINKYPYLDYKKTFEIIEDYSEKLDIIDFCIRNNTWQCLDYLLNENYLDDINSKSHSIISELIENNLVKLNLNIVGKLIKQGLTLDKLSYCRSQDYSFAKTYFLRLADYFEEAHDFKNFIDQYFPDNHNIQQYLPLDLISLFDSTIEKDKKMDYIGRTLSLYQNAGLSKETIIDVYLNLPIQFKKDDSIKIYEDYKLLLIKESKSILLNSVDSKIEKLPFNRI